MLATRKKEHYRSSYYGVESPVEEGRGHLVHQAARLVFCVYSGIKVKSIQKTSDGVAVLYRSDQAIGDPIRAEELFQMILSGGIAERRLVGSNSTDVENDLDEIEQIYNLVFPSQAGIPSEFDTLIGRCRRRVLFHLADPKIRKSIQFGADLLAGIENELRGIHLHRLIHRVRLKMAGMRA